MLTYLVAFALAFAVSAVLTPILRVLAPVIGGLDRAQSSRKVHVGAIPRIGGVAIVIAFFVPLVGLFFYTNDISNLFLHDTSLVVGLFTGGIAIAGLGFYDDLHGAGARLKFAVQIGVAYLVFRLGVRIDTIVNPFGPVPLSLTHLHFPLTDLYLNVSGPFTVLWIVGIINAMNLIDGLDGLAGGVALISIGLIFAVAFNRPAVLMCLFSAALGGAVMGFLLYNFNPATIFMGDTGSMFLGFVLATASVTSSQKGTAVVAMVVPIVALGLPIADTLLAMMRRWMRGRPLFSADKEHIHHRLLAMGLSHREAVLALYGICLLFALAAFGLAYASSREAVLITAGLGLFVTLLLKWLGYLRLDPEVAKRNAVSRERNQSLRATLRQISDELRDAAHLEAVWNAVKQVGPALQASEMTLSLVLREENDELTRSVRSWRSQKAPDRSAESCVVKLNLEARRGPGFGSTRQRGTLIVAWADGRREVNRDDEITLEALTSHVEGTLERLEELVDPALAGEDGAKLSMDGAGQVLEFRRRNGG